MDRLQVKICGMKYNVEDVAALEPDYLGFIFYDKSPRNFTGQIPPLPAYVKKVGVFVDAIISEIRSIAEKHNLQVLQLHGEESPEFCRTLNEYGYEIWKVFSVGNDFDFDNLKDYEPYVSHFLFDTKGLQKGGTGVSFNWSILKGYPSEKPIVLSGGIAPDSIGAIRVLQDTDLPLAIIDVNSRFERSTGLKDINALKMFCDEL